MIAIPKHLARYDWYAPHQAWLRTYGSCRHDPGDAEARHAVLHGADLRGADLRRANLRGAVLHGADLRGADLRRANLRGADLRRANLRGADLRGAYLRGAVLHGADLTVADLTVADLSGANLTAADLRDAVLTGADLSGAVLHGADLTDADLTVVKGLPEIAVAGLAARVVEQIEAHPETHDQGVWHSDCGTKHCAAGWCVVLGGDAVAEAEKTLGTDIAAKLALGLAASDPAPFGSNDDPLPWLRELADAS